MYIIALLLGIEILASGPVLPWEALPQHPPAAVSPKMAHVRLIPWYTSGFL